MRNQRPGRWAAFAVVVSVAAFAGSNAFYSHVIRAKLREADPGWARYAPPYGIAVYLLGGCGVAFLFLWLAARSRFTDLRQLGLGLSGWTAGKRLVGLALLLLVSYGSFVAFKSQLAGSAGGPGQAAAASPAGATSKEAASGPTWGDYCFWFVYLLPPSLAEAMVFVSVVFCLTEAGLRNAGLGRWTAAGVALVLSSVGFGLFHLSYPQIFWQFIPHTTAAMFAALLFFLGTRNFFLTLLLHNGFAAGGFLRQQFDPRSPLSPGEFSQAGNPQVLLLSFLIPFLALHWLEWTGQEGRDKELSAEGGPLPVG